MEAEFAITIHHHESAAFGPEAKRRRCNKLRDWLKERLLRINDFSAPPPTYLSAFFSMCCPAAAVRVY